MIPYKGNVSDEPLEIIEANECETDVSSLATQRFRRLFNEISVLQDALATCRTSILYCHGGADHKDALDAIDEQLG